MKIIAISREAAETLRDYVGADLPYEDSPVQAAFNELNASLDAPTWTCESARFNAMNRYMDSKD